MKGVRLGGDSGGSTGGTGTPPVVPAVVTLQADATLDNTATLRYLVDTSAGDVALVLAFDEQQTINLRNVGPGLVTINLAGGDVFFNSSTSVAYLTRQGDQIGLVKYGSQFYQE